MVTAEELQKRFTYHAPKPGQPEQYQQLRDLAKLFAEMVVLHCPEGREQALALTKIEEAIMWANAGISRA